MAKPRLIDLLDRMAEEETRTGEDVFTMRQMMDMLGWGSRDKFKSTILDPAMEAGLIRPLYPDKPTHPLQKYYIRKLTCETR